MKKLQRNSVIVLATLVLAVVGVFVFRVVEHANYLSEGSQRERDLCWVADGEWKDHGCYHKPNPFPEGGEWLCIKRSDVEYISCEDPKTGKLIKVDKKAASEYLDWRKNKG